VAVWQLLQAIIGQHLLPALLASAVLYVILAAFSRAAVLRRPAYQVIFLYAALLKVLLAVWTGEGLSCLFPEPSTHLLGYTAVSLPRMMVSDGSPLEARKLVPVAATSDAASRVLLAGLLLLLGFCVYRWIRIAPLYRRVHVASALALGAFPGLHRAFDELVAQAWGAHRWPPRPHLVVVRDEACFAFTMGIRAPVVVVSAALTTELGESELYAILAHEVAHVRRLDYIGRWFATVARDLMVWNPAALLWYRQLTQEQEQASDEYAAALVDDPVAVASGLVELAAFVRRSPITAVGPLLAVQAVAHHRGLESRLSHLEHLAQEEQRPPAWQPVVSGLVLLLFLSVQPHIVMPIGWILSRLFA
jgi:Zn-dependent protease with chaperone function